MGNDGESWIAGQARNDKQDCGAARNDKSDAVIAGAELVIAGLTRNPVKRLHSQHFLP
jgi:hypothetical protein